MKENTTLDEASWRMLQDVCIIESYVPWTQAHFMVLGCQSWIEQFKHTQWKKVHCYFFHLRNTNLKNKNKSRGFGMHGSSLKMIIVQATLMKIGVTHTSSKVYTSLQHCNTWRLNTLLAVIICTEENSTMTVHIPGPLYGALLQVDIHHNHSSRWSRPSRFSFWFRKNNEWCQHPYTESGTLL